MNISKPKVLILTGPPGCGKNTISEAISKHIPKLAIVDVDIIRWMIVKPHAAPWDGEQGIYQQILGVENACNITNNFLLSSFNTIILDVLTDETAQLYQSLIDSHEVKTVLLLPSFEKIIERNNSRPPRLSDDEIRNLYRSQENLLVFDEKVDNSDKSPDDLAFELSTFFISNA